MTTTTAKPASDKQIAYIKSLMAQAFGENADEAFMAFQQSEPTSAQASKQIEALLASTPKIAKGIDTKTPTATVPNGIHYIDQRVYRIRESKSSGQQYAERLLTVAERAENDGKPWLYEGRKPLYKASEATLLTLEQAKVFGKGYGICAVCGALLEDPESVEAGIGPVCAKKF